MRFRLSFLATALLLLITPITRAQVNCNATIIDQTGQIHNPQVIGNAARTLINQGAEVRVVIVDSIQRYGTTLSDVERSFEQSCPSWTTNGQRKANLFVVMVAPNDRAKNMFLGSYYAGAFDITSTYSALSNSYFKNRQWELGIAAVLNGTTGQAISFHAQQQRTTPPQQRAYTAPTYTQVPTQPTQSSSGPSGLATFFIVFLVLGLIGAVLYLLFRRGDSNSSTTSYGTENVDTTPVSGPTSSSSYRSRAYAAAAPSHTTVINNNPGSSGDGLVTGLVLGEMMSRPNNSSVVYEPAPSTASYPTPAPESDPAPTTQNAPDSTWEDTTQAAPDSGFSSSDSSDSSDSSSSDSSDSSFSSDSSSSDSGFGGGFSSDSSSSDSGFGGDSGGSSSGDSGF